MKTTDADIQTSLGKETPLSNTVPQQTLRMNSEGGKEIPIVQENSKSPNMFTGKSKHL